MLLQQPRQMQEHHAWPLSRARLGGSTTGGELPRDWQKHALLQQPRRGQARHAWPWSKARQDDSTRRAMGQRLGLAGGPRSLQLPR